MAPLQFLSLSSSIDPSFWHAFTKLKVDVLRLSDDAVSLKATYERGRWITDRETGQDVGLPGEVRLDGSAFEEEAAQVRSDAESSVGVVTLYGRLKNYNTIEEFKNADKQALFNDFTDKLWASDGDFRAPQFLLIAFADLKKYKYYYWFAFPAFVARPGWEVTSLHGWTPLDPPDAQVLRQLLVNHHPEPAGGAWLAKRSDAGWMLADVSVWDTFFAGVDAEERFIVFIDPSHLAQAPGWPLRNLLTFIHRKHLSPDARLSIIAWRDALTGQSSANATIRSLVATIDLAQQQMRGEGRPAAVGWEKNAAGKLGPRLADLGPMMDPRRLADQAVDLNLKLMRWRILPSLDLEKIAATRCLLLGAGTLGCYVARTLMAWGARRITLVDSAKVSFSNPVRQPLFEFEDCLHGGKPKAAAAAEALKRIYPDVDARGLELSIPMPGHPIPSNLLEQAETDVQRLEALFDEHDAIYLLMDSRESRWLPTLLGAAKRKLVMNVALGFDSYLVMRHGVKSRASLASDVVASASSAPASAIAGRLGCYFCNDIVAPGDSLTDRTLDQMCTVTRPGLAPIASATAVEIMTSILQHPQGIEAQADVPSPAKSGDAGLDVSGTTESILGNVPHQIRGFLARFDSMKLVGPAYDKCTGCSDTVVEAYRKEGFDMLTKAFNDAQFLERLTGLDKLYDEGEAALDAVDWDEGDEDDM